MGVVDLHFTYTCTLMSLYVSTYTYLQTEIKIFALGTMHTNALNIILTICAIVLSK